MGIKPLIAICFSFIVALVIYFCFYNQDSKSSNREGTQFISSNTKDIEIEDVSEAKAVSKPVGEYLNLKVGKITLIYFSLAIDEFPALNKRQKLLAKFNKVKMPATGWAIALKRSTISTRFEVYLQDKKGQGGWFALSSMDLKKGAPYEFIFIIKPGDFLKAFSREYPNGDLIDLGLLPLNRIGDINSVDNLQVTSGSPKRDVFVGSIKDVSFFEVDQILPSDKIITGLNEGFLDFLKIYKDNCVISFSEKDFKCAISQ